MTTTPDIRNNESSMQYETTIDGHTAYVAYDLEDDNVIVFTHTIVPDELGGRGLGGALAKHVLDDARARHLRVKPQCAFIASYMQKHPEYGDLIAG